MNFPAIPRITIHPAICEGQPTVRGLRYPVWQVLEWLASGQTTDEILAQHPALEPEDFRACLAFAAGRLKPLGHVAETKQDEKSEQWLLGRQGQWLAEQEFLKQLWERNPASNPA
ncbi:DUF433 domain-containing protein [Microvirga sp. STS02]|uniref:DUF433 domain-containing protein n=1 Tax=Hymenobacter negativus TaxID=2795026 RepID=UPI0018DE28ED|nr:MULTISPECIES: DUF433 domain-containing protein [Bacteria]MBH8570100.1 DUF433 domain-containing protein [Hymenobacter negativus]MBR7209840.1 DUF433 domain-containing protein [Microvirga sp. STS02]